MRLLGKQGGSAFGRRRLFPALAHASGCPSLLASASLRSASYTHRFGRELLSTWEGPPMLPMNMACQGSTVAQPAVMETRPARMPLLSAPGMVIPG